MTKLAKIAFVAALIGSAADCLADTSPVVVEIETPLTSSTVSAKE